LHGEVDVRVGGIEHVVKDAVAELGAEAPPVKLLLTDLGDARDRRLQ
jgi:hypothetical protein